MSAVRKISPLFRSSARDPVAVSRPSLPHADALLPYLQRIDEARWYSNFGPLLHEFEARLRARFVRETALATATNATQAIALSLQALQPAAGALCVMPSFTFAATAHAAMAAGLTPWFLDIDEASWMLEPQTVLQALRQAPGPVGAVVPVSAFGRMPDLQAWADFREETGLPVIVDAAAAFDAVNQAPMPVVVSLHATKALGIGEGGFVACEDAAFIQRFRALTTFGFEGGRIAKTPATNAKLSEYACAVGLAALDRWPIARLRYRQVAQAMRMGATAAPHILFQPGWGMDWVSSTCVVQIRGGRADVLERVLQAAGIESRRWWGAGCHHAPAFAEAPRTPLPVTEAVAESTLGLPFFLDMDPAAAARVADALTRFNPATPASH